MARREPQPREAASDRRLLHCKAWCFAVSGGQACFYAFLPVVYAQLGLSPRDIGVLTGVAPLVQAAASPAWAAAADTLSCHRGVMMGTLTASAALHCLLPLCPRRLPPLLLLTIVAEAVAAPAVPLADAAIGLTLQRCGKPFTDYGKQRLWGAVSWGFVFSPAIGALETYAGGRVRALAPYVGHVLCYAAAFVAARQLAQPGDAPPPLLAERARAAAEVDCAPRALDCAPASAADCEAPPPPPPPLPPPPGFLAVLRALRDAVRGTPGATLRLLLFFVLGGIMGTIGAFLFLWLRELGGSEALDGVALAMTCVSEVAVFYFAGEMQAKLGLTGCLHLVIACYFARCVYYAALPALGGAWAVLPIQLLHGLTFGLYWATGNGYARALAPPGLESSMQALFAGLNSLGAFVGNVAAGALVQRRGFPALFLALAATAVAAQAALAASQLQERRSAAAAGRKPPGYAPVAADEAEEVDEEEQAAQHAPA